MLAKTDNVNFLRDTSTGALINNNKQELELLKAQRAMELDRIKELNDLKNQVEELKRLILER
jgi:hypothetical protein